MALWLECFHASVQAQVVSGQPHTLHRAEYAYDDNGARTTARITARITRAATPSAEEVNVWSQWNSYNKLGQLKETLFGSLSGGTISTPLLQDSWSLDALGNWNDLPNAGVNPVGRLTTDYRPGTPMVREIADATDARNRIDARTDTSVGSQEIAYTYDSAGNLRSDGAFFYQYDAWNRLVQVNEALANQGFTATGPGADENPVAAQERWWPGRMLKHYKYDGLGRLIETQSPYPDVETALGRLRTERFYYDGVRRIQEVVTDPLLMLGLAAESGNPELQQVATGVRRLKQSEEECRMLQALVTDQCLVKQILREAMLENSNA
ncbi:MAG: RHS repeat protein [Phycisphaeraceae bacterium]|nr:RHS repeat protein [Phycisphaeraceae bacterium]